jgi:hypothetical protein
MTKTRVMNPRMRKKPDTFERARAAVGHVGKRTFADWMAIGIAILQADIDAVQENGLIDYAAAKQRLGVEKIVPPVGPVDLSHMRRIMKHYDEVVTWFDALPVEFQVAWSAPSTVIRYCPIFASKKRPKKTPLAAALKVIEEALEEMDEPQRRLMGNEIFHPFHLQVTRPDNPERSSIDQLADDLADRLRTAHASTRDRVVPRFVRMLPKKSKARK